MIKKDEGQLITIEQIRDLRRNIGFHFTPRGNATVIAKTGLKPLRGDLSSGNLGKEAINNVFFSYGLEGALQIYNNMLFFASKAYTIGDIQTGTFAPFIPQNVHREPTDHFSMLEGFELMRQYMENNRFIIFDVTESKYSGDNPTGEQIESINKRLKMIKLSDQDEQTIYEMIKKIDNELETERAKPDEEQDREAIERKQKLRDTYTIQLYKKGKEMIDEIRGEELEAGTFDRCDFDFGKLTWFTQIPEKDNKTALPHNAHTKIIETDNGLIGTAIEADRLFQFSIDGEKPANGLAFLQAMLESARDEDKLTMNHRPVLLGMFLEYVKLVERYKKDPALSRLLIKKEAMPYRVAGIESIIPERLVVDMSILDEYPGLQEFSERLKRSIEEQQSQRGTSGQQLGQQTIEEQRQTAAKIETAEIMMRQEKQIANQRKNSARGK